MAILPKVQHAALIPPFIENSTMTISAPFPSPARSGNRRAAAVLAVFAAVFLFAAGWFLPTAWSESLAAEAKEPPAGGFSLSETDEEIHLQTDLLEAKVRKTKYVTGIQGGSLLDRKTGFRDVGFGLDIVDWIMEPGSDEKVRDKLPEHMIYEFGNPWHGKRPKRSIEGPQICTKAGKLAPRTISGPDFAAVTMEYRYPLAAPGYRSGSLWSQRIVFPQGKRYFISADRIDAANSGEEMFLRIDMPGHIKHRRGDTFSEVYLSYLEDGKPPETTGRIPASEFFDDAPPDGKFNYRRDSRKKLPERFIRAYRLRDPQTGKEGPWLAGMTLDPADVYEAWCHQRGYVCMIEEIGGRPIKAGESFSAAYVVGFFDSIAEMHATYDLYRGHSDLQVDAKGWKLSLRHNSKPGPQSFQ